MKLRFVLLLTIIASLAIAAAVLGTGARAGAFPGLNGKIAFVSFENGTEIFDINPDGTGEANLTDNGFR